MISNTDTMTTRLRALSGPAAITGGVLWMTHYAFHLVYGLQTGGNLFSSAGHPLFRADFLTFFGAYAALGLALLGLSARLRGGLTGWRRAAAFVGGVVACLALIAGLVGLSLGFRPDLAASGLMPVIRVCGPGGVLSLFLGAILLALSALRTATLPRWMPVALLLFGLFTAPVATVVMPMEKVMPAFWFAEAHFFLVGLLWVTIGRALRAKKMPETSPLPALT